MRICISFQYLSSVVHNRTFETGANIMGGNESKPLGGFSVSDLNVKED